MPLSRGAEKPVPRRAGRAGAGGQGNLAVRSCGVRVGRRLGFVLPQRHRRVFVSRVVPGHVGISDDPSGPCSRGAGAGVAHPGERGRWRGPGRRLGCGEPWSERSCGAGAWLRYCRPGAQASLSASSPAPGEGGLCAPSSETSAGAGSPGPSSRALAEGPVGADGRMGAQRSPVTPSARAGRVSGALSCALRTSTDPSVRGRGPLPR